MRRSHVHRCDEILDEAPDGVTDGAHRVHALPGRVVQLPVEVALAGKHLAGVPQPIVTHTSDSLTASVVRILGTSADMSMPTSRIASTAAGFTAEAGAEPAERTSIRSSATWRSHAAAIWDRPALCMHANRTEGIRDTCVSSNELLYKGVENRTVDTRGT